MAVRAFVRRVAQRAAVPVFALPAVGWTEQVQDLALDPGLRLTATPREATVLLVAGRLSSEHVDAAARVHDQLPRPRATVCWGTPPPDRFAGVPDPGTAVPADGDVAGALIGVHRDLLAGTRRSEPLLLPDEPPAPWRGVGTHGQGGEGMMGGVPYGRPMAMTADDRDGLALDALSLRIGPWLPGFPPGLVLDVTLQGDVVQQAAVVTPAAEMVVLEMGPFAAVRRDTVPVADLETARVRAHLRWCARLLDLHGLSSLGRRVLRIAAASPAPAAATVAGLERRLSRILDGATAGVGRLTGEEAAPVGGLVARAAGSPIDVRSVDPAYRRLGFAPVTHAAGDARARWRQRLAEAAQAAALAERASAGDVRTGPLDVVETPRPAEDGARHLLAALPELLAGADWGDVVTTVASLDVEPYAAARDTAVAAP